jgi:hypothetical protein
VSALLPRTDEAPGLILGRESNTTFRFTVTHLDQMYTHVGLHTHTNHSSRSSQRFFLTFKDWGRVRVTLRLAVYRQSVRLGAQPLESHDPRQFFQLNPCGHSPYVTSSMTRRCGCLLWIGSAFVKFTYRTYSMLIKILPCALHVQYRLYRADHVYLTYLRLRRQLKSLERS